jgi:hypothetical protein
MGDPIGSFGAPVRIGTLQERTYATAEEAALSGYSRGAVARVVSVREVMHADMIEATEVIVDTVPSHPMSVICVRQPDGRWIDCQPTTSHSDVTGAH